VLLEAALLDHFTERVVLAARQLQLEALVEVDWGLRVAHTTITPAFTRLVVVAQHYWGWALADGPERAGERNLLELGAKAVMD
jgi:hypothetical protein